MRPLVLLLLAAVPLFAEELLEEKFRALVAKFEDESFETREKAEQDLIALGAEARPLMEQELAATKSAEARMRLRHALREIGRARWATGIKAGLEAAAKSGKPVLLVCADGPVEAARSRAGEALRRELGKPEVAAELNARFVLVWWNAEVPNQPDDRDPKAPPSEEGDAGPTGCIGLYFCTAKGVVRQFMPGWWSEKSLKEDLERVKAVFAATDASEGEKARLASAREVEAAAEKMAAGNPAEMAKPAAESEVRREVERLRKIVGAYHLGEDVTGVGNVEDYLGHRMKDLRQRWSGGQR